MPLAIEQLDVSKHNIVLSSCHAVSKGVITGPDQLHICYVHSPIRYAWDLQHQYLKEGLNKGLKGLLAKWLLHKIRIWDYRTANGVDHFIANSHFIARRIKKVYGRNSTVIYPPVDVNRFSLCEDKEDYYFTASRMVPYKRMDLIVEAFSLMPEKQLIVIGDGSEMDKIKSKATSNVKILGYQSNKVMQEHMQKAKAFVFAAEEDFGITPVEAQACGTPVIAFGKGGSLETVRPYGVDKPTGIFFEKQEVKSLIDAISVFESNIQAFIPNNCRDNALRFSVERFQNEISAFIESKWNEFQNDKKIVY
jgi:glycosyltransferase involved in cell wall biosynthesis